MTRLVAVRVVCDGCRSAAAVVYCVGARRALCRSCSRGQSQHDQVELQRTVASLPFCEQCDVAPAGVYCAAEDATLCMQCDNSVHDRSGTGRHDRRGIRSTLVQRPVRFSGSTLLPVDLSAPPTTPSRCPEERQRSKQKFPNASKEEPMQILIREKRSVPSKFVPRCKGDVGCGQRSYPESSPYGGLSFTKKIVSSQNMYEVTSLRETGSGQSSSSVCLQELVDLDSTSMASSKIEPNDSVAEPTCHSAKVWERVPLRGQPSWVSEKTVIVSPSISYDDVGLRRDRSKSDVEIDTRTTAKCAKCEPVSQNSNENRPRGKRNGTNTCTTGGVPEQEACAKPPTCTMDGVDGVDGVDGQTSFGLYSKDRILNCASMNLLPTGKTAVCDGCHFGKAEFELATTRFPNDISKAKSSFPQQSSTPNNFSNVESMAEHHQVCQDAVLMGSIDSLKIRPRRRPRRRNDALSHNIALKACAREIHPKNVVDSNMNISCLEKTWTLSESTLATLPQTSAECFQFSASVPDMSLVMRKQVPQGSKHRYELVGMSSTKIQNACRPFPDEQEKRSRLSGKSRELESINLEKRKRENLKRGISRQRTGEYHETANSYNCTIVASKRNYGNSSQGQGKVDTSFLDGGNTRSDMAAYCDRRDICENNGDEHDDYGEYYDNGGTGSGNVSVSGNQSRSSCRSSANVSVTATTAATVAAAVAAAAAGEQYLLTAAELEKTTPGSSLITTELHSAAATAAASAALNAASAVTKCEFPVESQSKNRRHRLGPVVQQCGPQSAEPGNSCKAIKQNGDMLDTGAAMSRGTNLVQTGTQPVHSQGFASGSRGDVNSGVSTVVAATDSSHRYSRSSIDNLVISQPSSDIDGCQREDMDIPDFGAFGVLDLSQFEASTCGERNFRMSHSPSGDWSELDH